MSEADKYRHMIRQLCEEYGIAIIPRGAGMLLQGPGVYILTTDLRAVSPASLYAHGRGA